MKNGTRFAYAVLSVAAVLQAVMAADNAPAKAPPRNFAPDQLVAWCIVPFDAKKRGPAERAEMIRRLGLARVAYDWRPEHVASFEEEIQQYQKHGIEFFAFWDWHPALEPLVAKYGIKPQIWKTCPSPEQGDQAAKVRAAAEAVLPLVETTRRLGLQLGLYNHGGWGGEPANLVAVCDHLRREHNAGHVGIVYNFHHGHDHIADFADVLKLVQPYLLCLNLNGMVDPQKYDVSKLENKVQPIGAGAFEGPMIKTVLSSSYSGPVGIIGHRADRDVEVVLRENLTGLAKILAGGR